MCVSRALLVIRLGASLEHRPAPLPPGAQQPGPYGVGGGLGRALEVLLGVRGHLRGGAGGDVPLGDEAPLTLFFFFSREGKEP